MGELFELGIPRWLPAFCYPPRLVCRIVTRIRGQGCLDIFSLSLLVWESSSHHQGLPYLVGKP